MDNAVGLSFTKHFEYDLVYAFVYGAGYAPFLAITFAVLTDILNSLHTSKLKIGKVTEESNGLGIGLYNIATSLPSIFLPLVYGLIVDHFRGAQVMIGYWILYGQCVFFLFLGILFSWTLSVKQNASASTRF